MASGDLEQGVVGWTEVRQGPCVMDSEDDNKRVAAPGDAMAGLTALLRALLEADPTFSHSIQRQRKAIAHTS